MLVTNNFEINIEQSCNTLNYFWIQIYSKYDFNLHLLGHLIVIITSTDWSQGKFVLPVNMTFPDDAPIVIGWLSHENLK